MDKENIKPEQTPEEAKTVGQFLKFTRMNQKKSVETVAKDLCIRKIYIKAIEDSDFNELPPIPYGVGFVRSYADYLGLNSERIAQCYKEEALPKKVDEMLTPVVKTHTKTTIPNHRQILTGIIAVIVLYLLWLMVSCKPEKNSTVDEVMPETDIAVTAEDIDIPDAEMSKASTENSSPADLDNAAAEITSAEQIKIVEDSYEDPSAAKAPSVSEKSTESASQQLPATDSRVVVKFNGDSWFEIRDSKKVYISGIFKKGYVYNVPNVPGLIFSVGRYYNVDVYIDGQLTRIAQPRRQTNISLDKFLNH